jgi:hypothetical protein
VRRSAHRQCELIGSGTFDDFDSVTLVDLPATTPASLSAVTGVHGATTVSCGTCDGEVVMPDATNPWEQLDRVAIRKGWQKWQSDGQSVSYYGSDVRFGTTSATFNLMQLGGGRYRVHILQQEVYYPPAGLHEPARSESLEFDSLRALLVWLE